MHLTLLIMAFCRMRVTHEHVEIALLTTESGSVVEQQSAESEGLRFNSLFGTWNFFFVPCLVTLVPNHLSLIENHLKEQKWLSSYKCAYLV